MVTRQDVERLKTSWAKDPHWDIEDTEGYEEYRDELAAFAAEKRAEWTAAQQAKLVKLADTLGIPGNVQAAQYYQRETGLAESYEDEATDLLSYYLAPSSATRDEIARLVEAITGAARAEMRAHVALELARLAAREATDE
jgi:hypothetical protein